MSSQQIACRLMAAPDLGGVAAMYRELQAYHGYAQDSLESLSEQLRGMNQSFEIVVAEQEGRLLGFALFSAYPGPGLHSGMFLKELFVTAEARGGCSTGLTSMPSHR
ncbi:L-amino acid N-acyltransferase YncA [Microvirga flocculans]|uniref:L-amino acid N-acyltransferase YncA n=1 Tax=Microvirga flocculans TaxID=217168 RepID=A0A7W6N9B9_9HYPH|nr:hypothetical protein [Microvirga flocculans]MBB4041612.1 L-amino acid N-acyltransferase YncA [Microvirga flocculans]